jgi:hypothetical protein
MSLKFPVFVRARKEQHLPPTMARKSLLEQLRETPHTSGVRFPVETDLLGQRQPVRTWVRLLGVAKRLERFGKALAAGQSVAVRGDIVISPLMTFLSDRGRLEERLEHSSRLSPIQSFALPSLLEFGRDTVLIGPSGSGKRSAVIYCACKIALSNASEPRRLSALLVFSSNEDLHFCRRWLFAAAGEKLKIARFGVCEGDGSVGDVCLATAFEIGDIYEQNRTGELNLQDVKFCGVVGADRVVVPPHAERLSLSCWNWLRHNCHSECLMMVSGSIAPRVIEAARMIAMGLDGQSQSPSTFIEVEQIDVTAWIDVVHSVLLVDDEMIPILKELLSCSGHTCIIVATNKKQVAEFESHLSSYASSDVSLFRQGKCSLITSEWAVGGLADIPRTVGTIINVGLPRSNFEEVLTSRTQRLLPSVSRSSVCEVMTLVPRRSARSVAKRLKAFLISTNQRVPFFLSCVPSQ